MNAFNGMAAIIGPFIFYEGVSPVTVPGAPEIVGFAAAGAYILLSAAFAFIASQRLHIIWAVASLVMVTTLFTALTVG